LAEVITARLVLDDAELPATAAYHLHAGEHGEIYFTPFSAINTEHLGDAQLAAAQVDDLRCVHLQLPPPPVVAVALHREPLHLEARHRRLRLLERGGQIPRSENGAIHVGDAEPEAVLGDVLGAAAEGQLPVAGLAPRGARGVEGVGAVGRGGYQDARAAVAVAGHRVPADHAAGGAFEAGGVGVHARGRRRRRRRQGLPEVVVPYLPLVGVGLGGIILEAYERLEAAGAVGEGRRLHDVQVVADGGRDGHELGRREGGQRADGARGGVVEDGAAGVVDADDAAVVPAHELHAHGRRRGARGAEGHGGWRQASVLHLHRRSLRFRC
jgi:hypothetical protein